MSRRWPIAGLMVLVGSVAASAASFEVVSGEGSMNHGLGFRPVTGRVAAQPGSTLHVPPGTTAFLVYDNGCRIRVTPGAFVRVQKNAPCDASGRDLAAPGSSEAQNQQSNGNSNDDAVNPYALGLVTAVGVGGLIWGITEVNKHNKNGFFPSLSP
jgi:hypothetical protein